MKKRIIMFTLTIVMILTVLVSPAMAIGQPEATSDVLINEGDITYSAQDRAMLDRGEPVSKQVITQLEDGELQRITITTTQPKMSVQSTSTDPEADMQAGFFPWPIYPSTPYSCDIHVESTINGEWYDVAIYRFSGRTRGMNWVTIPSMRTIQSPIKGFLPYIVKAQRGSAEIPYSNSVATPLAKAFAYCYKGTAIRGVSVIFCLDNWGYVNIQKVWREYQ